MIHIFWAIWYARNQMIFEEHMIPIVSSIAYVHSAIRDSNHLITGGMYNSQSELLLLRRLQVVPRPCKAPKILEVF